MSSLYARCPLSFDQQIPCAPREKEGDPETCFTIRERSPKTTERYDDITSPRGTDILLLVVADSYPMPNTTAQVETTRQYINQPVTHPS